MLSLNQFYQYNFKLFELVLDCLLTFVILITVIQSMWLYVFISPAVIVVHVAILNMERIFDITFHWSNSIQIHMMYNLATFYDTFDSCLPSYAVHSISYLKSVIGLLFLFMVLQCWIVQVYIIVSV